MTKDQRRALEAKALADYEAVVGKVILVSDVVGYVSPHGESVDLHLDPPAPFRVVKTDRDAVLHWCDEWLDPMYDVEPLTPRDPRIAGEDPRLRDRDSFWVYGVSYSGEDKREAPGWTLAADQSATAPPAKHSPTPEPWVLQGEGTVLHPVSCGSMRTTRIETSLGMIEVIDQTNEPDANARLIVNAPELVNVLRMFLGLNPECHRGVAHCGDCAVCRGQAVLNRIEGL